MHVDKPQRPRLGHAMNKLYLTSSLTFLKTTRTSKKHTSSHFTRVQANNQKFQHTLHSFLLRKELGSSLESFSWVHGFTHQTKDKSSTSFFFLLSQRKLEDSKTLLSSLPLIFSGPTTKKGRFFHKWFYFYFPSRTRNLVKVLATPTLESMISLKNF